MIVHLVFNIEVLDHFFLNVLAHLVLLDDFSEYLFFHSL